MVTVACVGVSSRKRRPASQAIGSLRSMNSRSRAGLKNPNKPIGAFIFGMVTQGIVFAGWDPNWFKAFLGAMLLLAVLVNLYVKNYASQRR